MPTEFNCQSATRVIIFLFYSRNTLYSLMLAMSACGSYCFVRFCNEMYAEVVLSELLEEPHHPVLNFPKGSFGQKKNLCTAVAFRANVLAAG